MKYSLPSLYGPLSLTLKEDKIRALSFEAQGQPPIGASPALQAFQKWLEGYQNGLNTPFPWDFLDLSDVTPFQKKVYEALWKIPFGQTVSYAELARRIGQPKACRAVGQANGKNPIPLLIPCHRVVASHKGLGGFSSGLDLKKKMLRHEGLHEFA